MDNNTKIKIQQILNAFETGKADGDYGAISVFNDGPGNIKQYTVGKSQTTEFGNLRELLRRYIDNKGIYADGFRKYAVRIGNKPSIYKDSVFEELIKKSALDPIMRNTQDSFFDDVYWKPALKFFNDNEFTLPLSLLVIYDTAIHSGPALNSPRSMMTILRKRFNEVPPVKGGDEKAWVEAYVNARHSWLANHSSRPILRKTIYCTNTFKQLIADNNWDLKGTIRTGNGVYVKDTITAPPIVITPTPSPKTVVISPPVRKKTLWDVIKSWFKS